ncbi:ROK family protein [Fusobacterium mortiferum]|uniref:ROK family protein n=1 Tax=Fusobacterium mortiferum TaxID=850 RepID=UPI001F3B56AF|nr:ROK family protein [Fusobacterium mortiferum]MCF2627958.1 ROK family protein [Fusobacterium mortiferum]
MHTPGRSSVSFLVNTDKFYSIGIQIELKKISFILIDLLGRIKKERTILNLEYNNNTFSQILSSLFNEFFNEIDKEIKDKILGIGISFPGIVDRKKLKILDGINLNLKNIDLNDIFKKYDLNVYLENDANACIYSEKILGKAQKDENFVVISIGSGIGAGVYINFFSIGLSNILLTFDINNIIISGNLAKYIEKYQQDILKNIQKNIFFKNYPLNILCSNLNERSSILGAALIPISDFFNLVNSD